jgi:hypothetical protein
MAGFYPADGLKTTEFAEFSQYLIDAGSPHLDFITNPDSYDAQTPQHTALLTEFYTYLMEKYFACECYGVGCESSDGGGGLTTQMIALAGAGVVALYLLIR